MPPDSLILAQNAPKMRLAAGLRPDPLEELIQRSPRSLSWVLGDGGEERKGKGKRKEGEEKGDGGGRRGEMRPILYPDLGDRSPWLIRTLKHLLYGKHVLP